MSTESEYRNKEFQKQVDTYVAWVNSQLKKSEATKPVKDLRTDLSDGVLLIALVEIIAGEKFENVRSNPRKFKDKQHNVRLILQYLNSQNIRIQHVTDKDIIEGNIKSIMRLILTLAAHFKPSSVGSSNKSVSTASTGAANATAALGDAHKRVSTSPGYRRHKSSTPFSRRAYSRASPASMNPRKVLEGDQSAMSSENGSFVEHQLPPGDPFVSSSFSESQSEDSEAVRPLRNLSSINSECFITSGSNSAYETAELLSECHEELRSELSHTKGLVAELQSLLLNGEIAIEGQLTIADRCLPLEASCMNNDSLIIQSRLDLCQHENNRLKNELTELRQEQRSALASKSALQSRVQQQDKEYIALKQQVLKLNFVNENVNQEKECLSAEVTELKRANQALSKDLSDKNMTIKHLRDQMSAMSSQLKKVGDQSKDKLSSVQQLESQVQELRHQVKVLQRFKHSNPKVLGNEVNIINESLHSLRASMTPHDSRHHVIDTLDQATKSLAEQASLVADKAWHPAKSDLAVNSSHPYSPKSRQRKDQHAKSNLTSIIYFNESNMTPVRATTTKKIGEITLRDVKAILQTSERYRFNFKALDPEFGTVKKEIFRDDEVVPGWEGKIVAWLEKR